MACTKLESLSTTCTPEPFDCLRVSYCHLFSFDHTFLFYIRDLNDIKLPGVWSPLDVFATNLKQNLDYINESEHTHIIPTLDFLDGSWIYVE